MLSRLRFAVFLPLAALLACASSSSPSNNLGYAPVSGDYVFTVAASTAKASIFSGNLAISGTSVSGVFRYDNPGAVCVSTTQDIAFNGSIVNSVMTLTSASFAGSVATLTIPLPLVTNTSGQQTGNGTVVISGGTCALVSTTAEAQYVPTFAGTWTGTLTGPVSGTASITITESAADSDGQFPATGAITFTPSSQTSCNFSIPISAPISGLVSGTTLQVANSASTLSIQASAATSPVMFTVENSETGPANCLGTYTGTLSN